MHWVLVLHFYQPQNQKPNILEKVVNESYVPIVQLLNKYPQVKVNVNFNGCLTEQLKYKYSWVLEEFKKLKLKRQVEFVGSAKNHALLPLIGEKEIHRQMKMGREANESFFGSKIYNPKVFLSSELAYAHKVYREAERNNYNGMIVDEISVNGELGHLDWTVGYQKGDDFKIIPVNREWLNELRGNSDMLIDNFVWLIKEKFDSRKILVTANDAELFGHHMPNRLILLERVFADKDIKFITVSDYLTTREKFINVNLFPGTWETLEEDLKKGKANERLAYSLWYDPNNSIQMKMWELAWMAISIMANFIEPEKDVDWKWHAARDHLDKGLSSCYWWWASCRPWWNPEMIEEGVEQLLRSIRSSQASVDRKLLAEKLRADIIKLVWDWHWSGKAQLRIDDFEKKHMRGLYWVRTKPVLW